MKKRILSLLMACCMIFGSLVLSPKVSAADSLVMTDHDGMYGAHLLSRTEITRKEDGSFDVTVDMYTYYAMLKENRDITSSADDFYVVDRDGAYLVELWGGDGASTQTASGGLGGYTYGVIELKKGDVIFYTLGGAGSLSATSGQGGGANGGGHCGPKGSTAVGGGGGYSAAFLYKNGEEAEYFYSTYTDSDLNLTRSIIESDRLSKYIMIAGGGGGAGSGTGDRNDVAPANGGAGGYAGTTSGKLDSAEGYSVSGTFYAGLSGSSTDGTGEYAGKGGDYLPGKALSTVLGWGEGSQPNDWSGSQNKQLGGGAGGDGNYRGGGGGGGFAGGSGGLVHNIALSRGVGGGGGGSSFISELFSPTTVEADGYRVGRERTDKRQNDDDGTLGGYFHIVYLDEENVDYMSNLTVELARTPFFTITKFDVTNIVNDVIYTNDEDILKDESKNAVEAFGFIENPVAPAPTDVLRQIYMENTPYDLSSNTYGSSVESNLGTLKFSIFGVSLMPNTVTGGERDHLTISLNFKPKDDFAGGNNVPLFAGSEIICRPVDQTVNTEHVTGKVSMKNFCGYVNVPMYLNPVPVNHTPQGLDPANTKHAVSSLFVDRYVDVREKLNKSDCPWQYYFIENIGYHTVSDEFGNDLPIYETDGVTEATISPDETTRYLISLSARAKAPAGKVYARLGDVMTDKLFTGWSIVTIAGTGMEPLGNNMVVYNKALSFDETSGEYILSLHLSSDSSGSIQSEDNLPTFNNIAYGGGLDENGQTVSRVSTVTIPVTGTYTLTLKGGDGGMGGAASFSLLGASGGTGGVGANITASFVLEAGVTLRYFAGRNADNQSEANKGALGGDASYVAVLDENGNFAYYLMIATGGPGGGGAGALWSDGANGSQPTAVNPSAEKITDENKLADYAGNKGADGGWGGSGSSGAVKASYIYSGSGDGITYRAPNGNDVPPHNVGAPASGTATGGTGTLTCTGLGTGLSGAEAELGAYVLETAISKYFTVTGVSFGEGVKGESPTVSITERKRYADKDTPLSNDDESYTYEKITAEVSVSPVALGSGNVKHVEFTVKLHLMPREGFLGGNDVKIIEPAMDTTGLLTGMKLSLTDTDTYINIDESRTLDYANVPIDKSLLDKISLDTQDRTYVYGDTLYIKNLVKEVKLPDLASYGWQADYLTLVDPSKDETLLAPEATTTYTLEAGVAPLYREPYATERDHKDEAVFPLITVSEKATVYTDFEVTFDLKHIDLYGVTADGSGRYLIPFGPDGNDGYIAEDDYVFYLSTSTGEEGHEHHLPQAIEVTVGDTQLNEGVDYIYDRGYDTGSVNENQSRQAEVRILRESIRGNVKVTAAACEEHHVLYYVYQLSPESDRTTTLQLEHKHYSEHVEPEEDFETAGATLPSDTDTHSFLWDFGALELDSEGHHVMPKGEAWVTGRYIPKEFTLTVKYVDEEGNELSEPFVGTFAYGASYNVPSPTISRYKPDLANVSGTVSGDVEKTVVYSPAVGLLTIHYVYADGAKASDSYSNQLASGMPFAIPSPSVPGHTPSYSMVEGTMEDDGLTFTVIYSPNRYSLTFLVDGEILETRTVEYGKIYSYDAGSGSYEPFPTPVKLGYAFEGWEYGGSLIKASDTVNLKEDTTLTARFTAQSFTITVQYFTDDEGSAAPFEPTVLTVTAGDTYDFNVPKLTGYTPDPSVLSGKMPAQNLVIFVTYYRNSYTVTVIYETPAGVETIPTYSQAYKYGEEYNVISPERDGYLPNLSAVSGVMGESDVTVTVAYYSTAITVEVVWGEMKFSYSCGKWNPETLTYSGGSLAPVGGSNSVKVTNKTQNKDVNVEFAFLPSGNCPAGIKGYFTPNRNETNPSQNAITQPITLKKRNGTTTAYFYLEDTDDSLGSIGVPDVFTLGQCTVIISEE